MCHHIHRLKPHSLKVTERNLVPRPSTPRFYLAAVEKNLGVIFPRLGDKIRAWKAWVQGYLKVLLNHHPYV